MNQVLKIAIKRVNSPVACCALSTRVGTRDEEPAYNGLAHFTEHMFFKGTLKRGANSINNALEKVGGELNAYTTKEETVLHATVLREDLHSAIDLLLELAFTSVFPKKELEKEREVILDEIVSYKDSPAEAIYDHFETLLFAGHPLAMPILGEKKTLRKIDAEVFRRYIAESFVPSRMGFTLVADIEEKKAVALVRKALSKYYREGVEVQVVREGEAAPAISVPTTPTAPASPAVGSGNVPGFVGKVTNVPFYMEISKKNHQAHCILGATAFSCFEKNRLALALLTNILGGPASNARLNMVLREKHALVYNVEASFTPYADTGIFAVYFGCDKGDVKRCLELVKGEIDKIVSAPLTEQALKAAKKQLMGQLSIAQDNAEAQCLSMGKSLLVYGKIATFEQMRAKIEAVTAAQLQEVAAQVLSWERMSVLIYN